MNNFKQLHFILGLFVVILLVAGCSTTTPTGCSSSETWYRPNTPPEETQHDLALCQYDALLNRRATSVYGDTVGQTMLLRMVADSSEDTKENQMIAACMFSKGYVKVKKNELPKITQSEDNKFGKMSSEDESKLIGRWEDISLKTRNAVQGQDVVEKQILVFFPNQRLLTETIYKNGKKEPRLNHYNIVGDNLEITDPLVAKPYTKTVSKFSLIDDQMILTTDNAQIILNKLSGTNTVIETDNQLIGQWNCDFKTNAVELKLKFDVMPLNRYNFKTSMTSPDKSINENEDGIYCYDSVNSILVSWSDKEPEPQWFKCYVLGNQMSLVENKVTFSFSRVSN